MEDLLRALPDDRPVTSICIVEDPAKCPAGFQVVDKTFDQDTDADLWKDGFFGRRITRYICISKEQGVGTEIVESIIVIGDRDSPPDGFIVLMHTQDSEQKATRKKYLCYKLIPEDKVQLAVTDVIVLSKLKKPPQGFTLAGELNCLLICYKLGTIIPPRKHNGDIDQGHLTNSLPAENNSLSKFQILTNLNNHVSSRTLHGISALNSVMDDIPFDLNPRYKDVRLLTEYCYDFEVEHQAQQAIPSELI